MGDPIRAGGHTLGEHGWELARGSERVPAPHAEAANSEPTPASTPEPSQCPDCGKSIPTKKDGTLWKHTCVLDAPPPQVTFDDTKKVDDGGDPAAEGQ